MVFLQGFLGNVAADRGFLMVKSWGIAGERWSENDLKSGAKNMPLFSEFFLRLPVWETRSGRRLPASESDRDGVMANAAGFRGILRAGTTRGGKGKEDGLCQRRRQLRLRNAILRKARRP